MEKIDDKLDEVFSAMGSALTRWSMVDRTLTVIYAVAVNPQSPAVAAASIWRVTGHNLKIQMIEEALEAMYTEHPNGDLSEIKDGWKNAKKTIKKAVNGRNDLGHSALYVRKNSIGNETVLQKDREKFKSLRNGAGEVRFFDVEACNEIERDCFNANMDLIRLLRPLDDFFRANRIDMRDEDAFPNEIGDEITKKANRRRGKRSR